MPTRVNHADGQGARKRLFPMPIEAIIDHPSLRNAPSVVYGSVMRILHHYWACECSPLPEATRELESIGRMTEHLWRNHGALIMRVVADVLPSLDHYYAVRLARRSTLRDLSARGKGVLKLQRAKVQESEQRRPSTAQTVPVRSSKRVDIPPVVMPSDGPRRRRTG